MGLGNQESESQRLTREEVVEAERIAPAHRRMLEPLLRAFDTGNDAEIRRLREERDRLEAETSSPRIDTSCR